MTRGRARMARVAHRALASCLFYLASQVPVHAASPAAPRIAITIGGAPDCAPPLRALLAAQLADLTASVVWSCQPRLEADEPFRAGPRTGADARVWIDLSAGDEVRLTLEHEPESRFVLRRLPLAHGLDEVGREEIAEVVRTATMAVLTGETAALTRAEARATASQWPPPAPRPASPAPTPPPAPEAPAIVEPGPTRALEEPRRIALELGPAWTLQALARELPIVQEVAAAAALTRRGSRLSVWMESGYRLPASYDGDRFGVRLTSLSLRAGIALWSSPNRPFVMGIGGGVGAERIWFSPHGDATTVDPAPAGRFDDFAGRVFVAVRLHAAARLVLGLDLHCDLASADVHFDLRDEAGLAHRVLTEWPVRPGLRLSAAWRWGG